VRDTSTKLGPGLIAPMAMAIIMLKKTKKDDIGQLPILDRGGCEAALTNYALPRRMSASYCRSHAA
jgi:hypothetical protein